MGFYYGGKPVNLPKAIGDAEKVILSKRTYNIIRDFLLNSEELAGSNDGDLLYWDATDEEWKSLSPPATEGDYALVIKIDGANAFDGFEWRELGCED